MRLTKRVARGLERILLQADDDFNSDRLGDTLCECDVCANDKDYSNGEICLCESKPYAKLCRGCRAMSDWSDALDWIRDRIGKGA